VLGGLPAVAPADFTPGCKGPDLFPAVGDPAALDFFCAVTLHQYGFWSDDGAGYVEPYFGMLDGRLRKGAEFMFRAYLRAAQADPRFLAPERQAELRAGELSWVLAEDDGECRIPMFESHLELAKGCGRHFVEHGTGPAALIAAANASPHPYESFVFSFGRVPGYAEDPLRKKLSLLAIMLKNRPERFLEIGSADLRPVVDYHVQRTFLRTGMVEIDDPALRSRVAARRFLAAAEEETIRRAVFDAVDMLCAVSHKDVAGIDWFFFSLRRKCYEMQAPDCASCAVDAVCGHHVELFQPIVRTTFY
jgi:hypothetical protein